MEVRFLRHRPHMLVASVAQFGQSKRLFPVRLSHRFNSWRGDQSALPVGAAHEHAALSQRRPSVGIRHGRPFGRRGETGRRTMSRPCRVFSGRVAGSNPAAGTLIQVDVAQHWQERSPKSRVARANKIARTAPHIRTTRAWRKSAAAAASRASNRNEVWRQSVATCPPGGSSEGAVSDAERPVTFTSVQGRPSRTGRGPDPSGT